MDGIFGFDFPFNNLVDKTANPVSLKTNTVSIVMNKIINHIKIKAAHTDAAEIPNIKVKLKNLCLKIHRCFESYFLFRGLAGQTWPGKTCQELNGSCVKSQRFYESHFFFIELGS